MPATFTPSRSRRFAPTRTASTQRRHAPLETVGATEHQQTRPASFHAECPQCGKHFSGSAVVVETPAYSIALHRFTAHAWLYCDHCDHLVIEHRASNLPPKGEMPTLGERLCEPGILRDPKAIERFLKAHPQAAGVE
jgi:hypothetical protein